MGWFRSDRASADDLAALRARVDELTGRLIETERINAELRAAVEAEPEPAPEPEPEPPPPPPPAPDAPRLETLIERLDALEARVANVSTELANQLSEIAGELDDAPTERIDAVEASFTAQLGAAVDDLRATTEALAAEQARYEIQFRADLAEVADRGPR